MDRDPASMLAIANTLRLKQNSSRYTGMYRPNWDTTADLTPPAALGYKPIYNCVYVSAIYVPGMAAGVALIVGMYSQQTNRPAFTLADKIQGLPGSGHFPRSGRVGSPRPHPIRGI